MVSIGTSLVTNYVAHICMCAYIAFGKVFDTSLIHIFRVKFTLFFFFLPTEFCEFFIYSGINSSGSYVL